ncbi:hypothetical protein METESE_36940 [Mesoterricola sediminis]|uniref:Uncharacterized protein n=1 Tax=Mesoterricola sediminis TaxID=2927980 RepID=A0AA48H7F1_9BACT|nr:hypothetical protein METESE_36940 [Mesoterricola sediminis]
MGARSESPAVPDGVPPRLALAGFPGLGVLALSLLLASCRSVDRSGPPDPTPLIQAFVPRPPVITEGDTAALDAAFTGQGFVQGLGPIRSGLPLAVTPAATTTYALTVLGPDGRTETRQATLQVVAPPDPPVVQAAPDPVTEQELVTLQAEPVAGLTYRWSLQGDATPVSGLEGPTFVVRAGAPGSLILGCVATNAAGRQSPWCFRVVPVVPRPPTPALTAPDLVTVGQRASAQVTFAPPGTPRVWALTNATLDSGDGTDAITFTPLAPGPVGLTWATGGVTCAREVTALAAPTISAFQAQSDLVGVGSPAVLQAAFADGTATVDPGGLPLHPGEDLVTAPLQTGTTFTLTVTNAAGARATRTCQVRAASIQRVAGFPSGEGTRDGQGRSAFFLSLGRLAADPAGNLYTDQHEVHLIRRITPDGTTTTFTGDPLHPGNVDGPLASARFLGPVAVAWSPRDGALFVADSQAGVIRRIQDGQVSTWAGVAGQSGRRDGPRLQALFEQPTALAAAPDGSLFVVDGKDANFVRRISPAGDVSTFAGSGLPGYEDQADPLQARFRSLAGLAVDGAGQVFVTDALGETLRVIRAGGVVETLAGQADTVGFTDDPDGRNVRFSLPGAIAIDPADGRLVVADRLNHRIRKVDPGTGATWTLCGSGVAGYQDGDALSAQFDFVEGLAFLPDGTLAISDTFNACIRTFDPLRGVQTLAGHGRPREGCTDGGADTATFDVPDGLVFEPSGTLYVADSISYTIRRVDREGNVQTIAGSATNSGTADGAALAGARFSRPTGLLLLPGSLLISDREASTLRALQLAGPAPQVTTLAGSALASGTTDGVGTSARFRSPEGIAQGADGVLYVADSEAHLIRKLDPDGSVTTLAGAPDAAGYVDAGNGLDARFNQPSGLALQGDTLYVTERGNRTLRAVDLVTTAVRTVAGSPDLWGALDGVGLQASFAEPAGVVVTPQGDLFIADTLAGTIRHVTPEGRVTTPLGHRGQLGLETGPAPGFLGTPRALALDPLTGDLCFTDDNAVMRVHFH